MSTGFPVLLVVEPGDEHLHGYALEQVAAHYDVVVITGSPLTWQRPFVIDHEVVADPFDGKDFLAAGEALAVRYTIAGVLTWTDRHLVNTARLARQLNVATDAPEVLQRSRDKPISRRLFAHHQIPSYASRRADSPMAAVVIADSIGYPVVLEPTAGAARSVAIRVDRTEEIGAAWKFASGGGCLPTENHGVLVEKYLNGPEVSVECVTDRGVTTAVAVIRTTVGVAPCFEETAHSVDAADPLLLEVAPVAAAAVKAIGITSGIQHVRMRLTDEGPALLQVNGGFGGDLIGHLVRIASGIDLPRAAADLACGRTPDVTRTISRSAAIRLLYPGSSGTLTALHLSPGFAEHTPWLRQVHWQREVGDAVTQPPEGDIFTRLGHVIVTGRTTEQVQQRMREALDQVTIAVDSSAPTPPSGGPMRSRSSAASSPRSAGSSPGPWSRTHIRAKRPVDQIPDDAVQLGRVHARCHRRLYRR